MLCKSLLGKLWKGKGRAHSWLQGVFNRLKPLLGKAGGWRRTRLRLASRHL